MKCLLLTLVVCCVTINTFAHAHDEGEYRSVVNKKHTRRPKVLAADGEVVRKVLKKGKSEDKEITIKDTVDPDKLSPDFIKKFDPDYKASAEPSSARSLDGAICLRDRTVVRMTNCLADVFDNSLFKKAKVRNFLRRYIHNKNVRAWFNYIGGAFNIPLDAINVARIVKCYIDQIPTK